MDDILKAYGEGRKLDEFLEIIDFDPELGFNPFFWITRRAIKEITLKCLPAYKRYREALRRIESEEMLKGQAFGL